MITRTFTVSLTGTILGAAAALALLTGPAFAKQADLPLQNAPPSHQVIGQGATAEQAGSDTSLGRKLGLPGHHAARRHHRSHHRGTHATTATTPSTDNQAATPATTAPVTGSATTAPATTAPATTAPAVPPATAPDTTSPSPH